MRTAGRTRHRYNRRSLLHEMDAVCVNAMRSPVCLLHPATFFCDGFVCVAGRYTLRTRTAERTRHRYNRRSLLHKMDAVCVNAVRSPHRLLHPATFFCDGFVCVTDSYTLHMRTAQWTRHRHNRESVIREMDAVCVNVVRSPHCLLHPATLYVMAMCGWLLATHCT